MAKYRYIQTKFWTSEDVFEMSDEEKLFFLFLLTSSQSRQCGVTKYHMRDLTFGMNWPEDKVQKHLKALSQRGKIKWNKDTKELAVVNWGRHNVPANPSVRKMVIEECREVKDKTLLNFSWPDGQPVDTVSTRSTHGVDTVPKVLTRSGHRGDTVSQDKIRKDKIKKGAGSNLAVGEATEDEESEARGISMSEALKRTIGEE